MEETAHRIYVTVTAHFRRDGFILPKMIIWEDGIGYKVERLIHYQFGRTRKSGPTNCDIYTLSVGGRQLKLYFERSYALSGNNLGRWFIEQ
jgi:hypothetical protein